ncbi:MAG: cell wall metabolism sensor histidine kinase WalK, partial [Nanoarchaeota archaeon]|nr:cell wall metabolism sensor histidine kinase WalK [Nanoarchaeota archaeon]
MIDQVISFMLDSAPYHAFFKFLGSQGGQLLKYSLEFIVFFSLTYMILSERVKARKKEYKYLGLAFMALTLKSAIMAFFYFHLNFSSLKLKSITYFVPVLEHSLEILGLIMLAAAFLFPVFKNRLKSFQRTFWSLIMVTMGLSLIIETYWFFEYLEDNSINFASFFGTVWFIIIKILLIISAIIITNSEPKLRYNKSIAFAFGIYLIAPLAEFTNILLFQNTFLKLTLFQHPFPTIATILFARVIFLKLVDKAYLKIRLIDTEQKYQHEKEVSELKDHFVSVVSHELRTPLTSMKLYLSLLLQGKFGKPNKKQKDAIGIIQNESNRLTDLINDILALNKYESNKEKLDIQQFFAKEIIDPLYINLAEKKGIKMKIEVLNNLRVKADKQKIKQVLINLIGNAIKFTPIGGTIWIKIQENHITWRLTVKDTGSGIEKDKIPKLFDKFYQVQSHMTRSAGGSGLGLTIAKEIVDLHKGKIEVESEVG